MTSPDQMVTGVTKMGSYFQCVYRTRRHGQKRDNIAMSVDIVQKACLLEKLLFQACDVMGLFHNDLATLLSISFVSHQFHDAVTSLSDLDLVLYVSPFERW